MKNTEHYIGLKRGRVEPVPHRKELELSAAGYTYEIKPREGEISRCCRVNAEETVKLLDNRELASALRAAESFISGYQGELNDR